MFNYKIKKILKQVSCTLIKKYATLKHSIFSVKKKIMIIYVYLKKTLKTIFNFLKKVKTIIFKQPTKTYILFKKLSICLNIIIFLLFLVFTISVLFLNKNIIVVFEYIYLLILLGFIFIFVCTNFINIGKKLYNKKNKLMYI